MWSEWLWYQEICASNLSFPPPSPPSHYQHKRMHFLDIHLLDNRLWRYSLLFTSKYQCYDLNSHMIRRLISFRKYLGNLNAVWQGLQDAYFGGDLSQLKLIESLASIWNCKTMICRSQHGQYHTVSCTLCGLEPSWSVDASLGKNVWGKVFRNGLI